MFTSNESGFDRILRLSIAASMFYLAFMAGAEPGIGTTVAATIGSIALLTGLVGFCPLYRMLGFSTSSS